MAFDVLEFQTRVAELDARRTAIAELNQAWNGERATLAAQENSLEAQLDAMEASLRSVTTEVETVEAQLAAMQDRIARLREAYADAVERKKEALRLAAELDAMSRLTVSRQVIADADGVQREFEVLQLGVARAYAVQRKAAIAGIGRADEDGKFVWQWNPKWLKDIAKAIDIASQEAASEVVWLPL